MEDIECSDWNESIYQQFLYNMRVLFFEGED